MYIYFKLNDEVERLKRNMLNNLTFDMAYYEENEKYRVYEQEDYIIVTHFTDKKINKKYRSLAVKYKEIIDRDSIRNVLLEIIYQAIESFNIDKINSPKLLEELKNIDDTLLEVQKVVDIRLELRKYISTRVIYYMDKLIINEMQNWTGTYRDRSNDNDIMISIERPVSLETHIYSGDGEVDELKDSIIEKNSIYHRHKLYTPTDEYREIINIIGNGLTENQKKIFYLLAITNDNQTRVAKILNITQQAVSDSRKRIINRVEKKVDKIQTKSKRKKLIELLERFLDSVGSESNVIEFTSENIDEDFIFNILYNHKTINDELRRYFIINRDNEEHTYTDKVKEFSTYFLKGVHNYLEMLKNEENIKRVKFSNEDNIIRKDKHGEVNTYKIDAPVSDNYIEIKGEKYYLVSTGKAVKEVKRQKYRKKDSYGNIYNDEDYIKFY